MQTIIPRAGIGRLFCLPILILCARAAFGADCASCHPKEAASYSKTGMARSFRKVAPAAMPESVSDFVHPATGMHYSMVFRYGRQFQRRWNIGMGGRETNVQELPVDYVIGSGNHARTYLSRTARGALIELPLGWYSEKGGYWAMNPGYDSPHPPSHRAITYECMFCHNGYPRIPAANAEDGAEALYSGELPEGIDCARCHGPGEKHQALARSGNASVESVRNAVVNPARLSPERQMDVCMQCHLETASTRLPGMIRRFNRAPFSFTAGEALGNFALYFDHASGTGHDDKFEIAGSAYRLRKSRCFLESGGRMTCLTCHDPHGARNVAASCRQCHSTLAAKHPDGADCASCHMPRRRTEDAVHVVMTDHLIQRRPPARDLLAGLAESHPDPSHEYKGEVVPYYPAPFPADAEGRLYAAVAQVRDGRNLTAGIARLERALQASPAPRAEFHMALGDAFHAAGQPARAVTAYQEAVKRRPDSARAWRYLGIALHESGVRAEAVKALGRALSLDPQEARANAELGAILSEQGRPAEAIAALTRATRLDPDLPDVWTALGATLTATGNTEVAEKAFRNAIRIDPYDAAPQGGLARLLSDRDDAEQSLYWFASAVRLQPGNAVNHYEYALALVRANRFDESRRETEAAIAAAPGLAEAHELLGGLRAGEKDFSGAAVEYGEAVRLNPGFGRAQLDLALALAALGDSAAALPHLREAAKSDDPRVAKAASEALHRLGQ